MRILIRGAGVACLTAARVLAGQGHDITVAEKASSVGLGASSYAGGMLAPWCEGETADPQIVTAGQSAIDWWDNVLPGHIIRKGTLVVAQPRDMSELERFASRTTNHECLDADAVAALEPALAGRFARGLFYRQEAHLDPRAALAGLYRLLQAMGVHFCFGVDDHLEDGFDRIIDCTGKAAIGQARGLRGVRGEMLYLHTAEVSLSRPVRLLHPRIPLYVVPQPGNRFMVGATMIESDNDAGISARSLMELLHAAYALHPAFSEAEVIETGTGIRPAFDDNIPRLAGDGRHFSINGMYRHGFLMAPHLAERLAIQLEEKTSAREVPA